MYCFGKNSHCFFPMKNIFTSTLKGCEIWKKNNRICRLVLKKRYVCWKILTVLFTLFCNGKTLSIDNQYSVLIFERRKRYFTVWCLKKRKKCFQRFNYFVNSFQRRKFLRLLLRDWKFERGNKAIYWIWLKTKTVQVFQ